jgi:DNA-damage-inducible protein D
MVDKKDLVVFQDKKIRRLWHDKQWFYSVVDIIKILTDSPTPRQYWGKVKDREFKTFELSPIWIQLKLQRRMLIISLKDTIVLFTKRFIYHK